MCKLWTSSITRGRRKFLMANVLSQTTYHTPLFQPLKGKCNFVGTKRVFAPILSFHRLLNLNPIILMEGHRTRKAIFVKMQPSDEHTSQKRRKIILNEKAKYHTKRLSKSDRAQNKNVQQLTEVARLRDETTHLFLFSAIPISTNVWYNQPSKLSISHFSLSSHLSAFCSRFEKWKSNC